MRTLLKLFTALVVALPASLTADPQPMKVGVILALSGPGAKWSSYQRMGVELALEESRAQGKNIELIFEDSKTEAPKAVSAFRKLTQVDRVDAVLGDIFAILTEPLIPLADSAKVLLLAPSLPASVCAKSSGQVFTAAAQIPTSLSAFSAALRRNPQLKKIASVHFDDPGWGNTLASVWKDAAIANNAEIVAEFATADFLPDFRSAFPKILRKDPGVFFIAHEPFSAIRALKELSYKGKIVFANNLLEVLTPDSKFDWTDFSNVTYVDTTPTLDFLAKFEQRFKTPRLLEAETSYEALRTIIKAVEANPENPAAGIRTVRYQGVVGPLDYSSGCSGQENWNSDRNRVLRRTKTRRSH
jgi:branched-chain amino acid transport system substrate-binding protein